MASASEVGEILRLKKEAMAAIAARGRVSAMKPTAEMAGAGKEKKVVKNKVPQAHIDRLKERLYTIHPEEIPEDELANYTQDFRDVYAGQKVITDKIRAYQRALLAQYEAVGFAEVEVTDDEEEAAQI